MFNRLTRVALAAAGAAVVVACTSHIQPLRPIQQTEQWVPDAAATQGAASATEPATRPGRMVTRYVDPNQTVRHVYKASYDNVWQQAAQLLVRMGFTLDRQDYRLGVITTLPLPSAQLVEFWKPQQSSLTNALENTIHNQRRQVRVTIQPAPGKPDFHEIAVQVLVERESNPTGQIGGPIFLEGSGFGRNAVTLRSDYAAPDSEPGRWVMLGRDVDLEKKLLDELFARI